MSLVIAGSLVLGDSVSGGGIINANNPLIGYRNLATASNVAATSAASGRPASNLANPSTNLRWEGTNALVDTYLTVTVNAVEPIDYIALARHNFGSAQIPVSVEGFDGSWAELVAPVLLPNDGPALFRFAPAALPAIRLRLQPGSAVPTAAVLYTGALLVLQRRIYVGHTPINYGRTTKVINGRSESGNFLGRIITAEMTETSVRLANLTAGWYRTYLDPFILNARERPFFFAWRPSDYPREVGYAWLTSDPQPTNQRSNGMMSIELKMAGVV